MLKQGCNNRTALVFVALCQQESEIQTGLIGRWTPALHFCIEQTIPRCLPVFSALHFSSQQLPVEQGVWIAGGATGLQQVGLQAVRVAPGPFLPVFSDLCLSLPVGVISFCGESRGREQGIEFERVLCEACRQV